MLQAALSCIRVITCRRGSTLVGYSSLALLTAIAAITLLGRANTEGDGVSHHRTVPTISSE